MMIDLSDAERQLLVVFVTKAWVEIRSDVEMQREADELVEILRKLSDGGITDAMASAGLVK